MGEQRGGESLAFIDATLVPVLWFCLLMFVPRWLPSHLLHTPVPMGLLSYLAPWYLRAEMADVSSLLVDTRAKIKCIFLPFDTTVPRWPMYLLAQLCLCRCDQCIILPFDTSVSGWPIVPQFWLIWYAVWWSLGWFLAKRPPLYIEKSLMILLTIRRILKPNCMWICGSGCTVYGKLATLEV